MTFASKYSNNTVTFAIRTNNPSYTTLVDLFNTYGADKVYPFFAIYINRKGQYGPQAVLALNETQLVNLPQHKLEQCEDMLKDSQTVLDINAGKCGFRIYQYQTKSGRTGYSVDWVDVDPKTINANSLPF